MGSAVVTTASAAINATTFACANTDMNIADENSKLSFYPIPTTDVLNFNNLPSIEIIYEIFSMEGKAVQSGIIMGKSIAIDELQNGMYFIKIISGKNNEKLMYLKKQLLLNYKA